MFPHARKTIAAGAAVVAAGAVAFGATLLNNPAVAVPKPRVPAAAPTTSARPTPSTPAVPVTDSSPPAPSVAPVVVPPPATPTPKPVSTPPAPRPLMQQGDNGSRVRELEARLDAADRLSTRYVDGTFGTATTKAIRTFQDAYGLDGTGAVDAATWSLLRSVTREPTHEQLYPPPPPPSPSGVSSFRLDPRCTVGHVICIDKTTRRLAWVVDGTVQLRLAVRFGSENTPTREGQFAISRKDADHVSTQFGSAMPYSMFFSGGEAVHYSSDFAARGYAGHSHGCVNVRDKDTLRELYGQVNIGDRVVVYRS